MGFGKEGFLRNTPPAQEDHLQIRWPKFGKGEVRAKRIVVSDRPFREIERRGAGKSLGMLTREKNEKQADHELKKGGPQLVHPDNGGEKLHNSFKREKRGSWSSNLKENGGGKETGSPRASKGLENFSLHFRENTGSPGARKLQRRPAKVDTEALGGRNFIRRGVK